ncbi:MAG: Chromosomal replication initiator protein DnaA [Chlamydiia bacterium]|nr:Chromosomal replication initiator protein DnaA [Chlamydiia bacterium]MCH9615414.1 Chromosomal replication initiator protein DnaA [Chlamydiia bacterium]MCH9628264.1 Chromosomal replication initiator protein DnaA [Chlamydiia bacterium]
MQAWEEFLKSQEKVLGKRAVDTWLRTLKVVKFDAGNLHLEASDAFQVTWFKEHVIEKVKRHLLNNNGRPIKVHIDLPRTVQPRVDQEPPQTLELFKADPIDPSCHFGSFVPGKNSQIAYHVLSQIAAYDYKKGRFKKNTPLPLGEYNPIYLYGPSGVGKTHLLMAVANALQNAKLKAVYVRAETFTDHVISAFRNGRITEFREKYRNLDALLIDDVQSLIRKNATQEELFHTFNTLHTQNTQMIFSANGLPRSLTGIEERLISRFEWGINLTLERLEQTELLEVAERRSQMLQFPLSDMITQFLAKTFPNLKSLTKAVEALVLRTHIKKIAPTELTVDITEELLTDLISIEQEEKLTPDKILKVVADKFGIRIDDILSKSQSRDIALPRQIAMYLCRKELKMPYIKIGSLFARDHSTVMSSIKRVIQGIESNKIDISETITEFNRKVGNM